MRLIIRARAWVVAILLAGLLGQPLSASRAQSLPSAQFNLAEQTVSEAAGQLSVTVTLSAAATGVVRVSYRVQGTSGGADHDLSDGSLNFPAGVTTRQIRFSIVDDSLDEGLETIVIRLNNPNGATLGDPAIHTISVQDDDQPPTVTVDPMLVAEGAPAATFTLRLSAPSGRNVSLDAQAVDDTARGGQDYREFYETVTFPAGEITRTVSVGLVNDLMDEPTETFMLRLTNPSRVRLGAWGLGEITDDDPPPAVQFRAGPYVAGEHGGVLPVGVALAVPSVFTVTVIAGTTNGTALAGSDFSATSQTVMFAPLQSLVTFSVPLLNDTFWESNETFGLTLSAPVNATLGARASIGAVIANDDPRLGCAIASSANVPFPIPDNTPSGVESSLSVNGLDFNLSEVSVRVEELQHPYVADLRVWLVAPTGVVIPLLNNIGNGADLRYTVFNDNAPSLQGATPPFVGTFRPNSPMPALNRLAGLPANGEWRLRLADTAAGDSGVLAAWGLELCGGVIPPTGAFPVYLPLIRR